MSSTLDLQPREQPWPSDSVGTGSGKTTAKVNSGQHQHTWALPGSRQRILEV